ncbi:hypothetical protein IJ732_08245 [bacterium]|nr:hypothetical protein [bacterium]
MDDRVQGIEEVGKKNRAGEVTDGARDAIMQAALNKAGGGDEVDYSEYSEYSDINMAQAATGSDAALQAQQAQQVQQVQETSQSQNNEDAAKKTESVVSPERNKATEKMLTSAIDQLALNNLNNLGVINPVRNEQVKNTLNESMMQAAMNKANPALNSAADKDMANVAQGTTAISDTAKKDAQSIETQQVYETGASEKMQEAKESGLSVGVKIEQPDGLEKQPATEQLLKNSIDQLAANNKNDLGIAAGAGASETDA